VSAWDRKLFPTSECERRRGHELQEGKENAREASGWRYGRLEFTQKEDENMQKDFEWSQF